MSKANSVTQVLPTHFIMRRLHSLFGLIPIGVFLLEHIFTNAFSLVSAEVYNSKIEALQGLPFVVIIEVFGIFLPILFHSLYGFVIWYEGKSNVNQYGYGANWRYTAQRVTGLLAFFYILYHVYNTRFKSYISGEPMTYKWMQDILQDPMMMWVYIISGIAIIFHFTNGLWTFMISWGITVTKVSQDLMFKAAMGIFAFLSVVNTLIVLNFAYPAGSPRPVIVDGILTFVKSYLFGTH